MQATGGGRGLKGILRKNERHSERSAKTSARLELLLQEEPGSVCVTCCVRERERERVCEREVVL